MALKKILSIILCAAMLLSVLTGCSLFGGGKDNPSDPTSNPTSTNGGTQSGNNNGGNSGSGNGDYGMNDPYWKNYDWDNFKLSDLIEHIEPVDRATFTVDTSTRVTGEFFADGETPLTLSMTDSVGLTWTLDIPPYALPYPTTITMTAMKDVTLDGLGWMDGGVVLEPDGLTFITPATLTVSGGELSTGVFMMLGEHDGGNVTLANYERSDGTATATIYHFSTDYTGDADRKWFKEDWDSDKAGEKYSYDKDGKKVYLKVGDSYIDEDGDHTTIVEGTGGFNYQDWMNPYKGCSPEVITIYEAAWAVYATVPLYVPEPPSLSFRCKPNHADNGSEIQALDDFLKMFMQPEWRIYQKILAKWVRMGGSMAFEQREYEASKLHQEDDYSPDEKLLIQAMNFMLERLDHKVVKLLDTYKYQEDKWKAIAYASMWPSQQEIKIVEAYNHTQEKEAKMEWSWQRNEHEKWFKELWNQFMKELVENHDYTVAHALQAICRFANMLNLNDVAKIDTNGWDTKLGNALTFRVEWELYDAISTAIISNLSGEAEVSMNQISEKEGYFGKGEGNGRVDSVDVDGAAFSASNLSSFSNNIQLSNLDPCGNKTIAISIDDFGENAKYNLNYPDMGGSTENTIGMPAAFEDKYVDDVFAFQFPIINLQKKCVDEKYENSVLGGTFVNKVTVRLIHEPKEDVFMR
jgi:hypothetical protein